MYIYYLECTYESVLGNKMYEPLDYQRSTAASTRQNVKHPSCFLCGCQLITFSVCEWLLEMAPWAILKKALKREMNDRLP